MSTHDVPLHTSSKAHVLPQLPQLNGSMYGRQMLPHLRLPGGHGVHTPAMQVEVALHAVVHEPQRDGSDVTSRHEPLQYIWPGGHGAVQRPAVHSSPTRHATPQPPQLKTSVPVSTHAFPHRVVPGGQFVQM